MCLILLSLNKKIFTFTFDICLITVELYFDSFYKLLLATVSTIQNIIKGKVIKCCWLKQIN